MMKKKTTLRRTENGNQPNIMRMISLSGYALFSLTSLELGSLESRTLSCLHFVSQADLFLMKPGSTTNRFCSCLHTSSTNLLCSSVLLLFIMRTMTASTRFLRASITLSGTKLSAAAALALLSSAGEVAGARRGT